MIKKTKTIPESKNFIVLDQYTKEWPITKTDRSEGPLKRGYKTSRA